MTMPSSPEPVIMLPYMAKATLQMSIRILRWRNYLELSIEPKVIIRVPIRVRLEVREKRRHYAADFKMEQGTHKPRNASGL